MDRLRRWWPLLVLAIAPLWPLWRVIFLGQGIGPWNSIRAMAPWNGPPSSQPWDVLQADGVLQFAPWRYMVLDAWGKGQLPLWNPHQLMGTPLLANSQSAGFYPPHIALGLLKVPVYPAMALLAWLHLFWAGVGTYKLSRTLRASRAGATIAGVSFALSPFMLSWTPLPSVISTVAWLPWSLFAALLAFQPSRVERAKGTVLLAVSTAMMCLAGHLQFLAYGLLALAVVGVVLAVARRGVGLVGMIAAVAIGFALAAPQLLPVLAFSKNSHRQSVAGEAGYQAYLGGAISPFQVVGIVYPTLLGHPAQASEMIPGANTYWPALAKPGADFAEAAIGIGPLLFAALFALRRNDWTQPVVIAVASSGLLGLLIALGSPFNRLLYFLVPGWSASGSPGRASVLFVLAASVVASVGITRMFEGSDRKQRRLVGVALAAGIFTIFFSLLSRGMAPDPYKLGPMLGVAASFAIVASLLWMAPTLAATLYFLKGKQRLLRGIAALAIPVLILNGTTPILSGKPLEIQTAGSTERIAAVNRAWELVTPRPALLPPNTASLMGLVDVAGYDSLLDKDTKALLDGANGRDSAPPTNGNMMFVKPTADFARLRELGVSQVWSTTPLAGLPSNVTPENGVFRYVLGGPGRASTYSMPATVTEDGYDHTAVSVYGGAPLVLRDRNMRGWTATVDGKPAVIEAAGPFRRVPLQRGDHTVVFHYWPPGLSVGLRLLGVGCVALIVLALNALRLKRIG